MTPERETKSPEAYLGIIRTAIFNIEAGIADEQAATQQPWLSCFTTQSSAIRMYLDLAHVCAARGLSEEVYQAASAQLKKVERKVRELRLPFERGEDVEIPAELKVQLIADLDIRQFLP